MRTAAVVLILLASASLSSEGADFRFIAFHGIAQQFEREGLDAQTCTATRILPPRHPYVDNTIASIGAAFALGAEAVTFDIHPTVDGEFVVFHDWTLDCRTDGHGVVREQTLAMLKSLDIGHGYTADGGATHPYRGKLVGAMPTWAEVMSAFPGRQFVVNVKSNDPREAEWIERYAARYGIELRALAFQGGDRPMEALKARVPGVRATSRASLKSCAWKYMLLGWSGYVPQPCRDTIVFVPLDYQPWLWGWPERFVAAMSRANTQVVIIAPLGGRSDIAAFGTIDDPAMLARIPREYLGLVATGATDLLRK